MFQNFPLGSLWVVQVCKHKFWNTWWGNQSSRGHRGKNWLWGYSWSRGHFSVAVKTLYIFSEKCKKKIFFTILNIKFESIRTTVYMLQIFLEQFFLKNKMHRSILLVQKDKLGGTNFFMRVNKNWNFLKKNSKWPKKIFFLKKKFESSVKIKNSGKLISF